MRSTEINHSAARHRRRRKCLARRRSPFTPLQCQCLLTCAPFNFSSISLSLLPRHEVPWCSGALGCVAVGHRFSAAALSHLLWFINKDIQSLIHHEGFPLKRAFTLPLLSWRGCTLIHTNPLKCYFFQLPVMLISFKTPSEVKWDKRRIATGTA